MADFWKILRHRRGVRSGKYNHSSERAFSSRAKPKTHINDNYHHHIEKHTQSLHHHHHSNPTSKSEFLFDSKQNPDGKPGLETAKSVSSCDFSHKCLHFRLIL